ncbi:MAG: inositol-3-phosphate synthase [Deltaproteobacteria bacterium]|nr:inositol-3-phosphate synthase [Deltaproteobacteria bacterium]
MKPCKPSTASGKLAVLTPGLGAVSTTFMAGVMMCRRGVSEPLGSLTQLGTIRLGKRSEGRSPKIHELVPLARLEDLCFGAWDIFEDDAYQSAKHAEVLTPEHLALVKDELEKVEPMPAVFSADYVKRLDGKHVKNGNSKMDLARALEDDIARFIKSSGAARGVMVWCGSTEVYLQQGDVHSSLAKFEKGLAANDPGIAPSMIYAYAALRSGLPFANGAPNLTVDIPALQELAKERHLPIAGKDFKTGQTLMKTVIAPALKARMLGLRGWFSTNILGNRDGEVLDDPESFKSKEVSKLGVLEYILQPHLYPKLYGKLFHKVRIEYYPPRGDQKEGWDNLDLIGWLGYPMQMKIDFLCRDSILAAPIVLDLALFMDLAARAKMSGIQEWLSFYFKSPMTAPSLYPEHDLFIQQMKLKNTLRHIAGEELITHLGLDYYE